MRAMAAIAPPRILDRALPASQRYDLAHPTAAISPTPTPVRLLVAPTNTAGQGWALARAAELLDGVGARTSGIVPPEGGYGFPTDQEVPSAEYRWSSQWQRAQRRAVRSGFTHVLLESGRPLFGDPLGRAVESDLRALRSAGLAVALLFHGSEVRLPSRHRERMPDSPFAPGLWSLTSVLEAQARRMSELADGFEGPIFVTTPDLLIDVPGATWLPVTIDPDRWRPARAPFTALDGPPTVAHVPSSAVVKGTDLIEPTLLRLHAEGVIRYRPLRGLTASEMPSAYTDADVVLDQFRIGTYGVAACEAMAAGRIVISNVGEQVRAEAERHLGEPLPIIEATTSTLESLLREVIAHPEAHRLLAARGPDYARRHHDGRRSAGVVSRWLTGSEQSLVD